MIAFLVVIPITWRYRRLLRNRDDKERVWEWLLAFFVYWICSLSKGGIIQAVCEALRDGFDDSVDERCFPKIKDAVMDLMRYTVIYYCFALTHIGYVECFLRVLATQAIWQLSREFLQFILQETQLTSKDAPCLLKDMSSESILRSHLAFKEFKNSTLMERRRRMIYRGEPDSKTWTLFLEKCLFTLKKTQLALEEYAKGDPMPRTRKGTQNMYKKNIYDQIWDWIRPIAPVKYIPPKIKPSEFTWGPAPKNENNQKTERTRKPHRVHTLTRAMQDYQKSVYAIQGLSNLIISSKTEDMYGLVHHDIKKVELVMEKILKAAASVDVELQSVITLVKEIRKEQKAIRERFQ